MSFITFTLYLVCVFIRPQDWVTGFLQRPLVNIFAVATIAFLFFESGSKPVDRRLVKAPQSLLMAGFFLTILLSHVAHLYFWGLTDAFTKFYPTFILFFVMLNALNSERRLKGAIGIIVLIMGALALQGISQAKNGYGWAGQMITTETKVSGELVNRINWVGIFSDPNDLALTFVIGIGLLLPVIFTSGNFALRAGAAILTGYLGYGIYLTNSRGGQIALMAAMLYFFIRRTKKFLAGGIFGGAAALAVVLLGPSRMGMVSSTENSAASRLDLWYGGLQLFKANPVFGRGFGMFMEELPQTAHNSYVLAMAELGFTGLFLWVAMIYISMRGLLMVQNNNKELAGVALGLQSALIGFCAAAFFLSRTYTILPFMLFAMAGSTVWLATAGDKGPAFTFDSKDFGRVFLIGVGIILLVMFMIRGR